MLVLPTILRRTLRSVARRSNQRKTIWKMNFLILVSKSRTLMTYPDDFWDYEDAEEYYDSYK